MSVCLLWQVSALIGAWNAVAFDLTAACSGFVVGLVTGAQFIRTRRYPQRARDRRGCAQPLRRLAGPGCARPEALLNLSRQDKHAVRPHGLQLSSTPPVHATAVSPSDGLVLRGCERTACRQGEGAHVLVLEGAGTQCMRSVASVTDIVTTHPGLQRKGRSQGVTGVAWWAGTCILFGDGCGAVVLTAQEGQCGLLGVHMASDGLGQRHLKVCSEPSCSWPTCAGLVPRCVACLRTLGAPRQPSGSAHCIRAPARGAAFLVQRDGQVIMTATQGKTRLSCRVNKTVCAAGDVLQRGHEGAGAGRARIVAGRIRQHLHERPGGV